MRRMHLERPRRFSDAGNADNATKNGRNERKRGRGRAEFNRHSKESMKIGSRIGTSDSVSARSLHDLKMRRSKVDPLIIFAFISFT